MKTLLEKIIRDRFISHRHDVRDLVNLYASDAIAVDVNNVEEWCREKLIDHDIDRLEKELYNITPQRLPFHSMWFEWTSNLGEHLDNPVTFGVLMIDIEVGELMPDDPGGVFGFGFMTYGSQTTFVHAFNLQSNDDGKTISGVGVNQEFSYTNDKRESIATIMITTETVIASLTFFSCKNIQINPKKMKEKAKKKFHRETGKHIPDFHVIEVHRFMQKSENEPNRGTGSIKSAHLVRGHFKVYGPDKKLLGKLEGKFFWHPHARGIGPVRVSEYRVWPPQEDHKNCIVEEVIK